jgi:hypothetical protein
MNDFQERYANPSEIRHTIGATGQLTINNVSGDIELRAGDGDEVVVTARTEGMRTEYLPITVYKSEGGLTIDVEKRGGAFAGFGTWFGMSDGIEFEAIVPKHARVEINTVSADVRSHFLAGEQSYKSVSGDIEVNADGGKLRVQTVSGDAQVKTAEPAELSVTTTSGDVAVGGSMVGRLDARTVSGDIEFEAGLGTGSVHTIETVSGDISIDSPTGVTVDVRSSMNIRRGGSRMQVSGDGAAQVRVRTLSGDCHVRGAHEVKETDDDRRRRGGKHGNKHERFERQLAQRINEQVRRGLGGDPGDIDFGAPPPMPPMPPVGPMAPMPPMPPMNPSSGHGRPIAAPQRPAVDQLEVLRMLERGEIDVDEAARRLQEA